MALPLNVVATDVNHLSYHMTMDSYLHAGDSSLPLTIVEDQDGHLAHHLSLATLLGVSGSPSSIQAHVDLHNSLHIQANVGPRGPTGVQTDSLNVSGWPAVFDGTIGSGGTYSSISDAATNGPAGGIFRVLPGTYTSPAAAVVKTGQQFWGDPGGVTLTYPAGTTNCFSDGGASKPNVKIANMTIVGFRKQVDCAASGGWEVAYCDLSAYNGTSSNGGALWAYQQSATPGAWVHHSKVHDSSNSIKLQDSTSGVLIEDCEVYNITGTDSFKPCLGVNGVTFRHVKIHNMELTTGGHGLWFDFHNQNCLVEWCEITGADIGMEWEANPGSVAGMGGNIARYNWVYGCNHHGIRSHGSSDIQVYGNVVGPNQQAAQVGLNDAELFMYINQQHITGQGSDLKNNDFHDNLVTTPSSGSNKRAAALQVQTGTGQPDPTPYTDGTKNLHFNADRYHLGTLLGSGSVFYWNTNKSWGGWQAIPQDAAGSAVA